MKKYLFMFLLGVLCPSITVFAGGTRSVSAYEPYSLRLPSGSSTTQFARKPTTNQAAFFNFEESPKPTTVTLNTRGALMTPISITESDMSTLIGNNRFQRGRISTATPMMDIGIADNVNGQTWTMPTFSFSKT